MPHIYVAALQILTDLALVRIPMRAWVTRGWSAVLTVLAAARYRPPKYHSHQRSTHGKQRKKGQGTIPQFHVATLHIFMSP